MYKITKDRIEADCLFERVIDPCHGAIGTFAGTVRAKTGDRATTYLEYEAYPAMAEKKMTEIAEEAKSKWPIGEVAILHRIGRLEVGEISVLVAVGAGHRREAMEACLYVIDRLKAVVPIWKKEYGPDGEFWVEGPSAEGCRIQNGA
ncbi:MAG: molybdenum cofactor biosynthesis protein MoaE [Candidatus Latescibacterota bacterium]|nr:molybdenum cofactor biosynthesis protein MoaE [Candidatus Latescibacterota bacterium]